LGEAARRLLAGDCVAIPTETVYGLAANALDVNAVASIFEIKNRPFFDPLIVHVASADAAAAYITALPDAAAALMARFWPGPLTLLLPRNARIPDLTCAGLPRVALRMPAHPMTLELLQQLPFPLAAPSANPFGYISPTCAAHVWDQLRDKIPYILDGGACRVGLESTIVGFESDQPVAYRLGGLSLEELQEAVGPVALRLNQSSNPAAPGMLTTHYAPRKPLVIGRLGPSGVLLDESGAPLAVPASVSRIGLLRFRPGVAADARVCVELSLTSAGDLLEAARHIFGALRALDQSDVELIVAETCPEEGLGRAVNDRLRRAAA
jgi:L-threonylcarbamoyladenylate synthase